MKTGPSFCRKCHQWLRSRRWNVTVMRKGGECQGLRNSWKHQLTQQVGKRPVLVRVSVWMAFQMSAYLCECADVLSGGSSWCTPCGSHWSGSGEPSSCRLARHPLRQGCSSSPNSCLCCSAPWQAHAALSGPPPRWPRYCRPRAWPPARRVECWWQRSWDGPTRTWPSPAGWRQSCVWARAPPSCPRPRCWRLSSGCWSRRGGHPDCHPPGGGGWELLSHSCPHRPGLTCSTGPPDPQTWGQTLRRRARSAGSAQTPSMSDVGWSGRREKQNTENNEHVQRHIERALRW